MGLVFQFRPSSDSSDTRTHTNASHTGANSAAHRGTSAAHRGTFAAHRHTSTPTCPGARLLSPHQLRELL
jgi:hypothetical protein